MSKEKKCPDCGELVALSDGGIMHAGTLCPSVLSMAPSAYASWVFTTRKPEPEKGRKR